MPNGIVPVVGPAISSALLTGTQLSVAAAWPAGGSTVEVDLLDSLFTDPSTSIDWTALVSRDGGVTFNDECGHGKASGNTTDSGRSGRWGLPNPSGITNLKLQLVITGSITIGATSTIT
jgi:hypothetical protein